MQINFYKYQGAGNDFVIIDNRNLKVKNDTKLIQFLCDRRFGIGADGLIFLELSNRSETDFKMVYFNADGNESTMCGNGGRCIVAFAKYLGLIQDSCVFEAIDGLHEAKITGETVNLKMIDVNTVIEEETHCFLNTGSPHHIEFVTNLDQLDVYKEGAKRRYSKAYEDMGGSNINFVQVDQQTLNIRTYERGVEDETLACGTGITAAAIAAALNKGLHPPIKIKALGGNLSVDFKQTGQQFTDVWLKGPAVQAFKGTIDAN